MFFYVEIFTKDGIAEKLLLFKIDFLLFTTYRLHKAFGVFVFYPKKKKIKMWKNDRRSSKKKSIG